MNRIIQKWPIASAMLVFAAQCGSPYVAMGATGSVAATACRAFTQQQISEIGVAMQGVLQSEQKSFAMLSAGVALFGCAGMLWGVLPGLRTRINTLQPEWTRCSEQGR